MTSHRTSYSDCFAVGALHTHCEAVESPIRPNPSASEDVYPMVGPPLEKLMVLGVSKQAGPRRIFEDEFTAALKEAGVQAVQSYSVIPVDGQANLTVLDKAVQEVGADGLLITRLVKTQRETRVQLDRSYGPGYGRGVYGWYGSAWGGVHEPARVFQYDVVTAETSVYGLTADQPLWSGTTQTFAPQDVAKETPGFAKIIFDTLKKHGII